MLESANFDMEKETVAKHNTIKHVISVENANLDANMALNTLSLRRCASPVCYGDVNLRAQ